MIRVAEIRPAGTWGHAEADRVVLGFDDRHRRRVAMTGARGTRFLLDLPEAVAVAIGPDRKGRRGPGQQPMERGGRERGGF